ncbi:hypothetical protein DSM112329_00781 [Paraconexibacter sp. AEG42_29]|uniref:EAL domain-containing protein n=1 Tax=Paraconexibacter sp. AEG42_29 TaxID=2997339 RepID=A0AAU7AQV0_9ACTN
MGTTVDTAASDGGVTEGTREGAVRLLTRPELVEDYERLEAECRRFRTAFESAAAGSAIATPDGVLVEVNETYAALVGRSAEELVGTRVAALTHPEDLAATAAYFRACLAGGPARDQLEKRFVRPDGTVVPVLVSAALVRDEQGAPAYVTAQVIDLSARMSAEDEARAARQRQRLILASLPGTVVALYDSDLRVVETEGLGADNPAGHTDTSVRGALLAEFLTADDFAIVEPQIRAALAGGTGRAELNTAAGREFEMEAAPFVEGGRVSGVLTVWRDVTVRNDAERGRRDADRQLRAAFDDAPIGMAMVGLDGRFTRCNAAICAITGRSAIELARLGPFAFVHPDDVPAVAARFTSLGSETDALTIEHRILHASGRTVWVQAQVTLMRDDEERPLYALAQVTDVSDRRVFEDRLRHMADHDSLTGLLNRRSFEVALESHLQRADDGPASGALMVLDVDQFKTVNDTLGHRAGDELILRLATVLTSIVRQNDVLARMGGDEFAVLLPHADRQAAQNVADKLLGAIRGDEQLLLGARRRSVTVSVGVCLLDEAGAADADDLVVRADLAMYSAKDAGRDRVVFWTEEDREGRAPTRLSWPQRISRAIDGGGLALEAQPIRNLRTETIDRYELLVRMLGHDGDLIPPAAFLQVAERGGMVTRIDRWVTEQAVALLSRTSGWPAPPVLEVNLSGQSVGDAGLLAQIEALLRAHPDVDPARLVFEVTETAAVADILRARAFAQRLSDLGCGLALDDFGSGFGSLYYLKHLPFDYLKIDGEFVARCATDRTDQLIVESAVRLAQGLGKETIAEFVGDRTTQRMLRALGVDHAQGFFVGRPAPVDQVLPSAR